MVGGVAITGGVGTVVGAALGALLLSVFSSTLVFLRVPSFWQQAFQGAMLLLAIAAGRLPGSSPRVTLAGEMESRMKQNERARSERAALPAQSVGRPYWGSCLCIAIVGGAIINKDFLTTENWANLLANFVEIALMASAPKPDCHH